jgi:hypothetical protein
MTECSPLFQRTGFKQKPHEEHDPLCSIIRKPFSFYLEKGVVRGGRRYALNSAKDIAHHFNSIYEMMGSLEQAIEFVR